VIEKVANVGEVINSNTPIVSISNPDSYYLKIFVDTINNGKIKLGDKAEIFLDAYPNKPIQAKVIRIAQRAEFTPKEVSVRSDRIQRVYEVRLKPLKYNPILKLGIPAIGIITIDGKGLPNSLDEIPEI
jgi:HlyD family secretion protein